MLIILLVQRHVRLFLNNKHLCGADKLFKVRYVDDLVIDMDGFIFPID